MSATARLHGLKPLVYINGTELISARQYTADINFETADSGAFGETWKTVGKGLLGWSGSIDAYLEHDQKILMTAATSANPVTIMIYPNRTDIADVLSGSAHFGTSFSGDTNSMQMNPGRFTGTGALTATGFS